MKKQLCCWLFAFAALTAAAQPPSSFAVIDKYARKVPDSVPRTIAAYTSYLVRKAPTPLLKARALYTWVAANISYDYDRYFSNNLDFNTEDSSMAELTFHSRRSVCAGFAALYQEMCTLAGLECVTIGGYARGLGVKPNQPVAAVNHDWNAVKLNNQWELVDATWASDTSFKTGVDDIWFRMEPINFAMTHFPEAEAWQLLDTPLTKTYFDQLPLFYGWWFRMDFYGLSALQPVIDEKGNFEITVRNDGQYELRGILEPDTPGGQEPVEAQVRKKGANFTISGKIPARGAWSLKIYAGKLIAARSPFAYAASYWGVLWLGFQY